jgi:hypothetical protein
VSTGGGVCKPLPSPSTGSMPIRAENFREVATFSRTSTKRPCLHGYGQRVLAFSYLAEPAVEASNGVPRATNLLWPLWSQCQQLHMVQPRCITIKWKGRNMSSVKFRACLGL